MSKLERLSWRSLPLVMLAAGALLAGCAPVGSGRWCANMKAKPKGDWTANEDHRLREALRAPRQRRQEKQLSPV